MNKTIVIFVQSVVVGALVISAILNLHYYVNLREENQNVVYNKRARALASYGSEVVTVAYFLGEYLVALDLDIIEKEVSWGLARAEWEAEICTQGLSEDSGIMYYELGNTALKLIDYFVWGLESFNATKIETIAESLYIIGNTFSGFDILQNRNPLEKLSSSDIDIVINYCRHIQDTVS